MTSCRVASFHPSVVTDASQEKKAENFVDTDFTVKSTFSTSIVAWILRAFYAWSLETSAPHRVRYWQRKCLFPFIKKHFYRTRADMKPFWANSDLLCNEYPYRLMTRCHYIFRLIDFFEPIHQVWRKLIFTFFSKFLNRHFSASLQCPRSHKNHLANRRLQSPFITPEAWRGRDNAIILPVLFSL